MKKTFVSPWFLAIATLIACSSANKAGNNNDLYKSTEYTPPGSFTSGAEGPAVDKAGNLYAVNYHHQGTIGMITPDGQSSIFVELPNKSIGNGLRFNSKGDLYVADYTNHNVLKVDMGTKQISVHAHEGSMSQPNDIAIDSRDQVYASDPNWKGGTGQIWFVTKDGNMSLLEGNMGTTNGIEVSPDDKTLYVNEFVQRKVWAYDLSPTGQISNKRLLIQFPDFGMDGMRCDTKGNLYICRHGKGTIAKVSPQGTLLTEIQLLGKLPSNIAFGGKDGRSAFVTLQDKKNIETFRVDQPGREWKMTKR